MEIRVTAQDNPQLALMRQFVHRKLEPWPQFRGALVVGSVAHGEARPDSDVDCVLVFDPLDEAIVPAELVLVPATDSYHTIFEVEATEVGGVQIDAKRMALDELRHQEWPEGFRHDLAHALVLADRQGAIAEILRSRLAYPDEVRMERLRDHLGWAEYFVEEWRLLAWIERGGIAAAHDQLTAAFEALIQLLHAYNREWLPWRSRWLMSAQRLAWLPGAFSRRAQAITSEIAATRESLLARRQAIASLLEEIEERLHADGLVANSDEAFIAAHPGLGYAHNFDAWTAAHAKIQCPGAN